MNLLLHKLEDMRGATSALNTIGAFEKGYTNPLLKDFPAKKLLKMAYSTTNYYSIQFSNTRLFRFSRQFWLVHALLRACYIERTLYSSIGRILYSSIERMLYSSIERTLYWAHAVLSARF